MEAYLLRTLTRKSSLKFGNYAETPIGQILKLGHTRYLRNIYYNCSYINFTDDILEELHIFKEYRIKKPGVDRELGDKLNDIQFAVLAKSNPLSAMKTVAHAKKEKKFHYKRKYYMEKQRWTKSAMQARNQGH